MKNPRVPPVLAGFRKDAMSYYCNVGVLLLIQAASTVIVLAWLDGWSLGNPWLRYAALISFFLGWISYRLMQKLMLRQAQTYHGYSNNAFFRLIERAVHWLR